MSSDRPGRLNPAHHHTHEQSVSPITLKGIGGRRDEMSVWGLEGRIHTEAIYGLEGIGGGPVATVDYEKDNEYIDPNIAGKTGGIGIPVPTLPGEINFPTHADLLYYQGGGVGDWTQLYLWTSPGVLVAASPLIMGTNVALLTSFCFQWDTAHVFTSCDWWFVTQVFLFVIGTDWQSRVLMQFVADEV